ncbi:MAG: hypothetical protein K6E91_10485 [Butyrivibrio sp.]|nr:hypothetical protein [Butyrivibrio sp.]
MRRVLEADLKRIMAKILPWLLILIVYIVLGVSLAIQIDTKPDRTFFFLQRTTECYSFVGLIIGFSVLLGVYGDEFKSMVMIGVIGRGISRDKFVLAKFFDTLILAFIITALTAIYVGILQLVFGVTLNAAEMKYLICTYVFDYIELTCCITIASIFYFLSENSAIGMFAFLAFETIIPVTIELLVMLSNLQRYHINRYYIVGLSASAYSDFILGDIVGALAKIFVCIAVYMVGALFITVLVFRKKELEF